MAKTAKLSALHLGVMFFLGRGYVIKRNPISPDTNIKLLPEGDYIDVHKSTFKTLVERELIEKVSEDALGEKYKITDAGAEYLASRGVY